MKKKRALGKPRKRNQPAPAQAEPKRRDVLRMGRNGAIALVALGAVGYFGVNSVQATMAENDLRRVGKGIPAVVQIHDPNCPTCRTLQKETRAAMKAFEDTDLLYLVANIKSRDGLAFANQHMVEHVTLVLLDGSGNAREILRGSNDRDTLEAAFADHLAALR